MMREGNPSKEQVWEKIRLAQSGNKLAMEELMQENMGLVRSVALRYRDRGVEFEDLVQIGVMGMFRAVKSFDFSYQTAFSTYAVPLIIGEIRRYLRDDGILKISRSTRAQGVQILREREAFREETGREGTPGEIAARLGMSQEDYVFALEAASPVRSLSEPMNIGNEELPLESVLPDNAPQMEHLCDKLTLEECLKKLPELERQVLYLRYQKDLSQQQTAKILGLTQVRVSRMEKKIFTYLRLQFQIGS